MTKHQRLIVNRVVRVANWLCDHRATLVILKGSKPIKQFGKGMERLLMYLQIRERTAGPVHAIDYAIAGAARQVRLAVAKLDVVIGVRYARDQHELSGWKTAKRVSPLPQAHRKHLRKAA